MSAKWGSGRWLIVGRMIPRCIPSMARASSMAAAAPRVWPIWDLLEETGIFSSCRPKTSRRQSTSTWSPFGVEVPWALMYWMSAGAIPASSIASRIPRMIVSGFGLVKW